LRLLTQFGRGAVSDSKPNNATSAGAILSGTVDADKERQWVRAAKAGDRTAFDALAFTHQARLRAFVARRVGQDAAEDVAQETLLAAWQALPRLELHVRFKTWLFAIAVHKTADYVRSHARRQGEMPLDDARLPADPHAHTFTQETEQKEVVRELLSRLSDDQRQLLELYYFAELTLPEIATALGRNLNTVKYQFYRVHAVAAERCASLNDGAGTEQEPASSTRPLAGERMVYGR
jgi:RNA polymerase sigma-70 factor (ECF subfamily)